eukprot:5339016-Pyramimonas_sp.AAC.1
MHPVEGDASRTGAPATASSHCASRTGARKLGSTSRPRDVLAKWARRRAHLGAAAGTEERRARPPFTLARAHTRPARPLDVFTSRVGVSEIARQSADEFATPHRPNGEAGNGGQARRPSRGAEGHETPEGRRRDQGAGGGGYTGNAFMVAS